MFNDNNNINEKSVIGFAAFVIMTVFAFCDIITGALGKEMLVNEFIFNAFLYLTLGCFGIASIDKWINRRTEAKDETDSEDGVI